MKHGVFVQLDDAGRFGVEDQTIHVFGSEESAKEWMIDRFIQAGELRNDDDGRLMLPTSDEQMTAGEAIELLNDELGVFEYFHCYPVIEHESPADEPQ